MAVLSAVLQIVRNTKYVPNPLLLATAFSKRFVRFGVTNPIAVMFTKFTASELRSFLSLRGNLIAFMKKLRNRRLNSGNTRYLSVQNVLSAVCYPKA